MSRYFVKAWGNANTHLRRCFFNNYMAACIYKRGCEKSREFLRGNNETSYKIVVSDVQEKLFSQPCN